MKARSRFLASANEDVDSVEYLAELQFLAMAEKICEAMGMRGFTNRKLARAMGVRESYITKLLSGEENLTLLTMTKVSHALGVNLSVDLMGCAEESAFAAAPTVTVETEGEVEFAAAA